MNKPSAQQRAQDILDAIGHELNEAGERLEAVVTEAIAEETNRCLAWLRTGVPLAEAIGHIEQYDDPPETAP